MSRLGTLIKVGIVATSLAGVWRSWGVVPDGVVGHSQGEIAAACVAAGFGTAAVRSRRITTATSGDERKDHQRNRQR